MKKIIVFFVFLFSCLVWDLSAYPQRTITREKSKTATKSNSTAKSKSKQSRSSVSSQKTSKDSSPKSAVKSGSSSGKDATFQLVAGKVTKKILYRLADDEEIDYEEYDFNMKIDGNKFAFLTYNENKDVYSLIINGTKVLTAPFLHICEINLYYPDDSKFFYGMFNPYNGKEEYFAYRNGNEYGPFSEEKEAFDVLDVNMWIWNTRCGRYFESIAEWKDDALNINIYDKTDRHLFHSNWDEDFVTVDGKKFYCEAPFFAFYDYDRNAFAWYSEDDHALIMYVYKIP